MSIRGHHKIECGQRVRTWSIIRVNDVNIDNEAILMVIIDLLKIIVNYGSTISGYFGRGGLFYMSIETMQMTIEINS